MMEESEHQGSILVVDDEATVARLLQQWLTDEGYAAERAGGFAEAQAWMEAREFDLVTLDIMMPEADGLEVLRWIRAHYPDVGVIMATAIGTTDLVVEAMRGGAIDYLLKPFGLDLVTQQVERGMERQRLIAQNRAYQQDLARQVDERTRELRQAHVRLQQYVRELEARDRLVHFLMEAHSLEEAYSEVLQVVAQMLQLENAVLCLPVRDGDLAPVMTLGMSGPGRLERGPDGGSVTDLVSLSFRTQKLQRGEGGLASVPILYRDEILGALQVTYAAGEVDENSLNALWRLGGEIALVLQGAAMVEDLEQRCAGLESLDDLA